MSELSREEQISSDTQRLERLRQMARIMALAIVLAAPAAFKLHDISITSPDIWWHLRAAEWIVEHHTVPRVDEFSSTMAGRPWVNYSWLYELIVYGLFRRMGLLGVVVYTTGMIFAITLALFHLIQRLQRNFALVALLTFTASYALAGVYTPRPWLFTIFFFIVELDILLHARRTGRTGELLWLPLLFAVWSNLHIEFIDGLAILGVAAAEAIVARWWTGARTALPMRWAWAVLLASGLATLANPYGWRLYRVAHFLSSQAGALNTISEMQSIPFRSTSEFSILFLALAASSTLAWRRRFPPFETVLLALGAIASFRSIREVWVVTLAATAILAQGWKLDSNRTRSFAYAGRTWIPASILGAAAICVSFPVLHVNNAQLAQRLNFYMPVRAVEVAKQRGYPGPVYNEYAWGGYLIWSLRLPVSIDGRGELYSDKETFRSYATWDAKPWWDTDANLFSAGMILGSRRSALTQLLRRDPRFELVYEDPIAAIFIPRK